MNKRGFIRIIEAVIAVIIIFGYIVTILPQDELPSGRIPPELDNTLQALLKEIQSSPSFRNEVIYQHDLNSLSNKIDGSLPPFSPWKYGFKLCKSSDPNTCGFYVKDAITQPTTNIKFNEVLFNTETSIYTKALFLSKGDIIEPGISSPGCNPTRLPTGPDSCENLVITFYMWSTL